MRTILLVIGSAMVADNLIGQPNNLDYLKIGACLLALSALLSMFKKGI